GKTRTVHVSCAEEQFTATMDGRAVTAATAARSRRGRRSIPRHESRYGGPTVLQALTVSARHWSLVTRSNLSTIAPGTQHQARSTKHDARCTLHAARHNLEC